MKIELAFSSCSAKWVPQSFERNKWSIVIAWAELKPDSILVLSLACREGAEPGHLVPGYWPNADRPLFFASSSRDCYGVVWMN